MNEQAQHDREPAADDGPSSDSPARLGVNRAASPGGSTAASPGDHPSASSSGDTVAIPSGEAATTPGDDAATAPGDHAAATRGDDASATRGSDAAAGSGGEAAGGGDGDPVAGSGSGGRALRITVARTGGVAGMSPRWSIEASEESDVDSWLSLVESCPWDAPDDDGVHGASGDGAFGAGASGAGASGVGASGAGAAGGRASADRFVYTIRVLVDAPDVAEEERGARVPERHLDGPWRDLVDRVKKAARD